MKEELDILFVHGLETLKGGLIGYVFPLASQLEAHNYTFKILDAYSLVDYSIESIVSELENLHFKTIGMTTNSDNIPYVYKACKAIKEKYPHIPIILGGPQVSHSDQKTLNDCDCDIIIRGYGEYALIGVLDSLIRQTETLENVAGISFIKDGVLVRNAEKAIDINSIPIPQYSVLRKGEYWITPRNGCYETIESFLEWNYSSFNFFLTGRGCPYSCAFCSEGNNSFKYQYKDIKHVEEDLLSFITTVKPKMLYVSDDTFTSSPKRVREFCAMLRRVQNKTYPFTWFAEGRVDVLSKNPELIGEMYDTGLIKLQLGVESGVQKTLDAYNKRITLDQTEIVIKECGKYEKMRTFGNIMLANPHESFDDFLETLDFFEKLILVSNYKFDFNIVYLAPFAGTPIRLDPDKYGLQILIDNFEFNAPAIATPICKPKKMTMQELFLLRPYARKRLMGFLNDRIPNLPSKQIREILRLNKIHSTSYLLYDQYFRRLPSLDRYGFLTSYDNFIHDVHTGCDANCVPVRLWNIEYADDTGYYFNALHGEKRVLNSEEVKLWRLASGKNTLQEIHKRICENEPGKDMASIVSFYRELENKMAIIFRKH